MNLGRIYLERLSETLPVGVFGIFRPAPFSRAEQRQGPRSRGADGLPAPSRCSIRSGLHFGVTSSARSARTAVSAALS
jgi:hypothetical protein